MASQRVKGHGVDSLRVRPHHCGIRTGRDVQDAQVTLNNMKTSLYFCQMQEEVMWLKLI